MDQGRSVSTPAVKLLGNRQSSSIINNRSVVTDNNTRFQQVDDQLRAKYQKLNREILIRTQSYNSTAKPFNASSNHSAAVNWDLIRMKQFARFEKPIYPTASQEINQQQNLNNMDSKDDRPNIVHKQYNSPINLYSMDNIKKSIEAHTEMIAPGLKGINFMKPETPVNKESELYKLIKEEERMSKSTSPVQATRVSPISGNEKVVYPSSSMNVANMNNKKTTTDVITDCTPSAMANLNSPLSNEPLNNVTPVCSECGLAILGPFARILERNIHAHCFNCSTCGTSLKNVGFFTVNEKLYCDVHAKQVAKVLHLNYDFGSATSSQNSSIIHQNQQTTSPQSLTKKNDNTRQQIELPHSSGKQSLTNHEELHKIRSTSNLQQNYSNVKQPICISCGIKISGPYIMAGKSTWCKPCSITSFKCQACGRSLLSVGFIEDSVVSGKGYCENCYESYFAPICFKCNLKIKGDCLNALDKQWHPSCFVCGHCRRPFGNSSFYLEDDVAYCERDWNLLFTTKCFKCGSAIEAGDKWIEALDKNYHSGCFRCSSCEACLEGSVFYCKAGKPYCRLHAR